MNDDRKKNPQSGQTEDMNQNQGSKGGQSSNQQDESVIGSTQEENESATTDYEEDLDTF